MSERQVVSIIIVSFNTRDVLRECLASVKRECNIDHEVIVIDNASPDGSANMVASEFPNFQLIRNSQNVGFSPANNQGMGVATGRYILLLNPDTVLLPNSVEQWIQAHERTEATISGPRLIGTDGKQQESAWRIPGVIDALLELFYLHRIFHRNRYSAAEQEVDHSAGFVSGAAMLFQREVFVTTGGLDPELFWMEDTDLCYRVERNGGRVMYLQQPKVIHIGGESSKKNVQRAISNQLISRIKFTRKHQGPLAQIAMIAIVRLHVVTRILLFGSLQLFRNDPRASAYSYTFGKLNRYLYAGDRSI